MNHIVKKIAIYSLAGLMQFGVGASLIEASPRHIEGAPVMQAYDQDGNGPGEGRFEKMRQENERHERDLREIQER